MQSLSLTLQEENYYPLCYIRDAVHSPRLINLTKIITNSQLNERPRKHLSVNSIASKRILTYLVFKLFLTP